VQQEAGSFHQAKAARATAINKYLDDQAAEVRERWNLDENLQPKAEQQTPSPDGTEKPISTPVSDVLTPSAGNTGGKKPKQQQGPSLEMEI
jgi:hypothetical protein